MYSPFVKIVSCCHNAFRYRRVTLNFLHGAKSVVKRILKFWKWNRSEECLLMDKKSSQEMKMPEYPTKGEDCTSRICPKSNGTLSKDQSGWRLVWREPEMGAKAKDRSRRSDQRLAMSSPRTGEASVSKDQSRWRLAWRLRLAWSQRVAWCNFQVQDWSIS